MKLSTYEQELVDTIIKHKNFDSELLETVNSFIKEMLGSKTTLASLELSLGLLKLVGMLIAGQKDRKGTDKETMDESLFRVAILTSVFLKLKSDI